MFGKVDVRHDGRESRKKQNSLQEREKQREERNHIEEGRSVQKWAEGLKENPVGVQIYRRNIALKF